MKRRALLASVAAILGSPALLRAQQAKRFLVGALWLSGEMAAKPLVDAFVAGLRDRGYVPGHNLILEMRYADGDIRRLPSLADELITLNPDVLVGVEISTTVLRERTKTIPIVLPASVDPIGAGLVQSLARPGTNVTGMAYRIDELVTKHIELLREIVPKLSHVALVSYALSANGPAAISSLAARNEEAARQAAVGMNVRLSVARVLDAQSVRQALGEARERGAEALIVSAGPVAMQLRREITSEARRMRLPSVTALPGVWIDAGGLMTYGPAFLESYRYAATYVDRILKGADPATLPLEQPAKFELLVNLKVAREIGVTIPHSILLRADRVID